MRRVEKGEIILATDQDEDGKTAESLGGYWVGRCEPGDGIGGPKAKGRVKDVMAYGIVIDGVLLKEAFPNKISRDMMFNGETLVVVKGISK